jgi:hypothetical protein
MKKDPKVSMIAPISTSLTEILLMAPPHPRIG